MTVSYSAVLGLLGVTFAVLTVSSLVRAMPRRLSGVVHAVNPVDDDGLRPGRSSTVLLK
jgi:hypothetical protein